MNSSFFSQEEIFRYSRHLMVPEIGLEGQRKLKESAVLIIGAGGLGSPAALYLAAAGVGRIGLVDDDVVDLSNLQRQILHGSISVDHPKVDSGKQRLMDLNPHISIDTFLDTFNHNNAASIAAGYDLLLDCSDNFATRYLVNDLCVLSGKPDVYGAVYRFEGQVSIFDPTRGPCYRCLFPEPPPEGLAPACAEAGVFALTPGLVGSLQAVEAVKLILGIGEPLIGKLLMVDSLSMQFRTIHLRKNPDCPACGDPPGIDHLEDTVAFCALEMGRPLTADETISPEALAAELGGDNPPFVLDVRSEVERQISHIPGAVCIPLERLGERQGELDQHQRLVVFCRNGTRSRRAVLQLKEQGFAQVRNLSGGINAWVKTQDPSQFEY